jgi:hypothetical protein
MVNDATSNTNTLLCKTKKKGSKSAQPRLFPLSSLSLSPSLTFADISPLLPNPKKNIFHPRNKWSPITLFALLQSTTSLLPLCLALTFSPSLFLSFSLSFSLYFSPSLSLSFSPPLSFFLSPLSLLFSFFLSLSLLPCPSIPLVLSLSVSLFLTLPLSPVFLMLSK